MYALRIAQWHKQPPPPPLHTHTPVHTHTHLHAHIEYSGYDAHGQSFSDLGHQIITQLQYNLQ